jgi:hypothetical protein
MGLSDNAAALELTLDGSAPAAAATRLLIPSNKAMRFRIDVVAFCVSGDEVGDVASWELKGSVKNNGGTTRLVGDVIIDASNTDESLAACTCVATAQDATDSLAVTFRGIAGEATNKFRVHASVYLSEVGY